jgi:uncharacterized protein (DUF2252 family)
MTEGEHGPTDPGYSFPPMRESLADARARGRALRQTLPRGALAEFARPDRDAVAILEHQHEDRIKELVPIRVGRMLESPFSYYRGTAAVMANDLALEANTGVEVVVCGDAHVSNFGLFASPERRLIFDLNDFDETTFGPWEWDVKRLVASALVGARQLGFTAEQCDEAARQSAFGYCVALQALFSASALERFYFRVETDWLEAQADSRTQRMIRRTIKKARRRTSDHVLAKITTTDDGGGHRIVDEFPVVRHDDDIDFDQVALLFDMYRRTARTDVAVLLEQFHVVDSVLRIVGVGSVGTRCSIALLLGPSDEPLFIQVKEAPPSVLETYGKLHGAPANEPGRQGWRVVAGQRILQAVSDPFLGWLTSDGRDYYCRQFRDMKGSLELETLSASQFADYGRTCGAVLGRAHAQSPEAAALLGYLGRGTRFIDAMCAWSNAYADQIERDYAALEKAVQDGRLPCEAGV